MFHGLDLSMVVIVASAKALKNDMAGSVDKDSACRVELASSRAENGKCDKYVM